ncbi:MAG: stage 0 sporulation family protein [Oscillospiraceae bacterium]|nr:stage 0 sporulation family protein [Oscillospiraceae bacterium]
MITDETNDKKNIKNTPKTANISSPANPPNTNISGINTKEKDKRNFKPRFFNHRNQQKPPVNQIQNNQLKQTVQTSQANQSNQAAKPSASSQNSSNIQKPANTSVQQNQQNQINQINKFNQPTRFNPQRQKLPPMIKAKDNRDKYKNNRDYRENKDVKDNKDNRNNKPAGQFNQFKFKTPENRRNPNFKSDITDNNADNIEDSEEITSDVSLFNKEAEDDTGEKIEIIGVRFKPVGKIYFFYPDNVQYSLNDKIIVETSRGLEMGYVIVPNKNISLKKVVQPLKYVARRASDDDVKRVEKNKKMAKEALRIANERIKFHKLKMKLTDAEYTFDNSKLLYYFTADGRIDFRELVKDLASIFKIRIELRQIGIRDQTKILGGLSICGRPFCCNSFLQDFAQVTIKMAKEQNISINSAKISGACGKLMCCLKYEHDTYEYLSKDTPRVGAIVETSAGETGVISESNVLTGICKVKINQKGMGEGDNVIKLYSKRNLKIIGFMKNDQEYMKNGANAYSEDVILESLGIIEDEPASSAIDIDI